MVSVCQQLHELLNELNRVIDSMTDEELADLREKFQPAIDEATKYCAKKGIVFLGVD